MSEVFLKQQGRKMESVLGDGNCLFRAISFCYLPEPRYAQQNSYRPYQYDKKTTSTNSSHSSQDHSPLTHISNMSKLGTWEHKLN